MFGDQYEKIVAALCQCGFVKDRSRRDDPHDFPLNDAFRQLGVFHLLANRHPIAFGNQPGNIAFHGMIRNPAHRDPVAAAGFARRKRDFQLPRRQFCIVKKQFIKVTQAKHQQILWMLPFNFPILFHHRRIIHRLVLPFGDRFAPEQECLG